MTIASQVRKSGSEKQSVIKVWNFRKMECICSRAEGENRPFWKGTVSGMGDQSMYGSRFRTFHDVSMTAPPFGATLESLTVPLLFTCITVKGPVKTLVITTKP
jgi:hypothetical protein